MIVEPQHTLANTKKYMFNKIRSAIVVGTGKET